ncbi:hypothetical protein FQA39_LY03306 [Lamprigera yunnana]|nr:hypothetical protein FQA39_LY03306 [Lamprigera yunnana]
MSRTSKHKIWTEAGFENITRAMAKIFWMILSVSMYGYYNFLLGALDDLEDDDNIIIIPPEVDHLTDVEEFNDNEIQIMNMPNDVPGNIEIMENGQADEH